MVESLFDKDDAAGVFRGFVEGGMEFHADLVLPYRSSMNDRPMHGMYLLIQLENPNEAVLGRITSIFSDGKLASGAGEDYNIRAVRNRYAISESLKEEYLKYRVNVRVLGGLKLEQGKVVFVPSFRRIPSVGAPVCFPSDDVLKELANSNGRGTTIGLYALGEYIYAGDKAEEYGLNKPWMNIMSPEIPVKFDVNAMVARRTFVFARAGFGKSNLNKLLFSQLYKQTPVKHKGNRDVPVGTVIFDRDGEYFWPDDSGRPGLCDVEELRDNLVVFTNREAPNGYYGSFVAGTIKIDIRELPASTVISLAVSQDRQEQQNIKKLKALTNESWKQLIDLVYEQGYNADMDQVKSLLKIADSGDAEAIAAISNITNVVKMLHDPSSRFMELLLRSLSDGKLCIVDMSQYGSDSALVLSGIILSRIFDHNQKEFTKADSKTIPTIAVLEEAQSVLTPGKNATAPFISWVKEGRKYDLGALMITQQPGSISTDLLSQGDNWFVFHLLSDKDLQDVRRANAHFSNDILSSLLNEPIVGQGIFWSSVDTGDGLRPYPIPIRVSSFEHVVKIRDLSKGTEAIDNYVARLKSRMREIGVISEKAEETLDVESHVIVSEMTIGDSLVEKVGNAIKDNPDVMDNLMRGIPWGVMIEKVAAELPQDLIGVKDRAHRMVRNVVTYILGDENVGWKLENRMTSSGKVMLFIVGIRK